MKSARVAIMATMAAALAVALSNACRLAPQVSQAHAPRSATSPEAVARQSSKWALKASPQRLAA